MRPHLRFLSSVLLIVAVLTPMLPGMATVATASAGPQYISSIVGNSGAAVTSHIVTMPASERTGDMLITCLSFNGAPTVTWPATWNNIVLQASTTVVEAACAYSIDDGALPSTMTVTTGTAQGDANFTFRIRGAAANQTPLVNTINAGASSSPATVLMPSSQDEVRLFLAVYAWSAGTVSTTAFGNDLPTFSPTYPAVQSQWNNAAGTGIVGAYKVAAENYQGVTSVSYGSSVTAVRFLIAVLPGAANATPDQTFNWMIFGVLLFLWMVFAVAGVVRHPAIAILGGIAGLVLALQLWTWTSSVTVTALTAALALMTLVYGAIGRG